QPHHVEPTLLQIVNVAPQFLVIHLRRLLDFLLEISRCFADGLESRNIVDAIVLNGSAAQVALPTFGADPLVQATIPMRAVGVYPMRKLERSGVELKDGKAAEQVPIGIEELIVVDIRMLAKNPLAIRIQISLRRFALDQVAERVLPLVGVRKIKLVEEKQS